MDTTPSNRDSLLASPRPLLTHTARSAERKSEILYQWAYDAAEMAVAEEEGMPGTGEDMLRPVLLELHELTGGVDVEHIGPTKQHGLAPPTGRANESSTMTGSS